MRLAWLIVAAVACVWGGLAGLRPPAAQAADIRVEAGEEGRPRVFVSGEIELGDAARFRSAVRHLPPAVVYLDGPGGKLIDALAIGDRLRERGDVTAVATNAHCTSACALIWVAGVERSWQDGGAIGFHAAAAREDGVVRMTASGNAIVGAYLTRLGYPVSVVVMATEAEHTSMAYLTEELAAQSGLTYERVPRGPLHSVAELANTAIIGSAVSRHRVATPRQEARREAVAEARRFMDFYFSSANASPKALRTLAGRIYADRVDYFGARVTRAELIAKRGDYAVRWPLYTLRGTGAPSITCTSGGEACVVNGEAALEATNPASGAVLQGTLAYTLRLRREGASFRVISEDSVVVDDHATQLTRRIQTALTAIGCRPGPVDGLWGARTQAALTRFVRAAAITLDTARPTYDALALLSVVGAEGCAGRADTAAISPADRRP